MKLSSLIDEKFGLPGNPGRKFGEKFMKDFITPYDKTTSLLSVTNPGIIVCNGLL